MAAKVSFLPAYLSSRPHSLSAPSLFPPSLSLGVADTLRRQYVVTPALAQTSTIGTAQTQAQMPVGGTNVANMSTVSASSVVNGQPAFAAIDGNIGGCVASLCRELDGLALIHRSLADTPATAAPNGLGKVRRCP